MPGPVRPIFAAAMLAAVCGCAQAGKVANPLAVFRKPAPEKKVAAKDDGGEPAPFKPAEAAPKKKEEAKGQPAPALAETAKAETAKAETAKAETPPAAAEAKPAEAANKGASATGLSHDAATLAMIEEELRLASAGERAKLYEEFKSLDGEMVRQLVRINRMVRDLEASKTAAAAPGAPPLAPGAPSLTPPAGGAALASVEPEVGSRVLNLGGPAAVPPIVTAEVEAAGVEPAKAEGAAAPPEIRPAGHSVPAANGTVRTAAAIGHSTTRPVPVLEALAGGPAAAANGSAGTAAPDDAWAGQLRQLISVAEGRGEQARAGFLDRPNAGDAARKAYVESQVHLRLLYLMAGDQARAMQAIPGLEAADQEFWQQVLWGVSSYFDEAAMPNRADRTTQTVEQLRTAVTRLQGEANLSLRNVAFCRKITSFGSYEKFDRDEFSPGEPVLLYAEIQNFKSVPQPSDGLFRTQLKSTVEVYRAGEGQPLHKIDFEPTTDLCRSYRQDYFHSYELTIPSAVTLGPHVMKLRVEDLQTGKLATYSVNFTVK